MATVVNGGSVVCSLSTLFKCTWPQQGGGGSNSLKNNSLSLPQPSGQLSLAYGSAAGQANVFFAAQYTLATSATQSFDLTSSSLKDAGGGTLTFGHVKWLAYSISSGGDATGVTRSGYGSTPWEGDLGGTNPTQTIYPTSCGYANGETTAGWATTSGANTFALTNNSVAVAVTLNVAAAGTIT